ncbi:MAG: hypothetical protein CK428_31715, partial [Mycobacterium sp.]
CCADCIGDFTLGRRPVIALAVFAVMFSLSEWVVVGCDGSQTRLATGADQPPPSPVRGPHHGG